MDKVTASGLIFKDSACNNTFVKLNTGLPSLTSSALLVYSPEITEGTKISQLTHTRSQQRYFDLYHSRRTRLQGYYYQLQNLCHVKCNEYYCCVYEHTSNGLSVY